jgi:hypothetical protein
MWYIRIYTGNGDVIFEYKSVHMSVYTSPPIFDLTQKAGHVKSNLHEFGTCKINFLYIRYYLAAKIDFTRKPMLAAPDLIHRLVQLAFRFFHIISYHSHCTFRKKRISAQKNSKK